MKTMRTTSSLIFLLMLFLIFQASIIPAAGKDQSMILSIPAAKLRQIIRDELPMPFETQNEYFEGDIIVDSLDNLQVNENSILLQGEVTGRNLAINTDIAGQNIRMKLGEGRLPVSCELVLRFDKKTRVLFVAPRFSRYNKKNAGAADALLPLLSALGGKEYPVEMDALQPLLAKVQTRDISRLEPADIQALEGMLVVKMKPRANKSR